MILTPPLPHQTDALKSLLRQRKSALFLGMGLGKSLIALMWLDHLHRTKGLRLFLITSDKNNVVNTWPDQIARHSDFYYLVRPTEKQFKKMAAQHPGVLCVVANYEFIRQIYLWGESPRFDAWVGDESASFKFPKAEKSEYLYLMVKDVEHRLIMDAKPMTERVEDLFGQYYPLNQALGPSITAFRKRYMMPGNFGWGWEAKPGALSRVKRTVEFCTYWKESVPDVKLPEVGYVTVKVDPTKEQRKIDADLCAQFWAAYEQQVMDIKTHATLFIKRHQLTGGVFRGTEGYASLPSNKDDVLVQAIRENSDAKIIVWHTYIPETERLAKLLFKARVPHVVIQDPMSPDWPQWEKAPVGTVLLIRTSFGRGLNRLVDADMAIFWSNPFAYARRAQAEGRTRRLTSPFNAVYYYDITTNGGADEVLLNQLSGKKDLSLTLPTLAAIMPRV